MPVSPFKLRVVVLLSLAGCASHGFRDTWAGPNSVERFQSTHNRCFHEANYSYVPMIAAMSGGHNIQRTVYKDCMSNAGYMRLRTEDVPISNGRVCGALQPMCKMELPILEPGG